MKLVEMQALKATTGAGTAFETVLPGTPEVEARSYLRSFQASLVGGGSATVKIQASNDNNSWLDLATIRLTAAAPSDGFSTEVPWYWVRSNITAIATGSVNVVMAR